MAHGLEVRVPFADHRLVEYVFNVPWEFKCPDGRVKGLLRDAAKGLLPDAVLNRKKSPYPKTFNPGYEIIMKKRLSAVIEDESAPIRRLIDPEAVRELLDRPAGHGNPWFGQLMCGPQMIAWLWQINEWLIKYGVSF